MSALRNSIGTAFVSAKEKHKTTYGMKTAKAVQTVLQHRAYVKLQNTRFSKFLTRGIPASFAQYRRESTLSLRLRHIVCEGHSPLCRYLDHARYIYMTSHAVSPRCITCRHSWHGLMRLPTSDFSTRPYTRTNSAPSGPLHHARVA
jgi:hypothetical protein